MPKPASVDAYMAALPERQRKVLEDLRATIRKAAPHATETINYDMPAFRQDDRFLVSYAAYKNHCSLFPASGKVMEELGSEVEPYFSGRGTLRFTVDDPIPSPLVARIVEVRLAELRESRP
jgi:uncharacterized protein YdhG (YjbR/CyaY superfamily)